MSARGRAARRLGSGVVPRNRFGDRVFTLAAFLARHRRFPKRAHGGLNDAIYHMLTSDEILDPLRVFVSDKELVKLYVTAKAGAQWNVPTLALLRSPEQAASFAYPSECAIKPTHLSGEVILRTGGAELDRARIRHWFEMNQYDIGRGANYRSLVPKVIVEPLLFGRTDIEDLKIHCVSGVPKLIQVDMDRHVDHRRTLYTPEWQPLPFGLGYPLGKVTPAPPNLDALLSLACALSEDFSLMRVDLYSDGVSTYLGELTNCHGNGTERFTPREADATAARLLFGEGGFSVR